MGHQKVILTCPKCGWGTAMDLPGGAREGHKALKCPGCAMKWTAHVTITVVDEIDVMDCPDADSVMDKMGL